MPVSALIAFTVAPETLAPLASLTVPEILAVTLAKATPQDSRMTATTSTEIDGCGREVTLLPPELELEGVSVQLISAQWTVDGANRANAVFMTPPLTGRTLGGALLRSTT